MILQSDNVVRYLRDPPPHLSQDRDGGFAVPPNPRDPSTRLWGVGVGKGKATPRMF